MSEIRNLTRNSETFYPLTHIEGVLDPEGEYIGYYTDNPEWIKVILDNDKKILAGIKSDGSIEWSLGVPQSIKDYINENIIPVLLNKVDKEEGKSLINSEIASSFDYKESPEFLSIELDENEKVLGGRKINGTKFENVGLDLGGAVLKGIDDPEGRIEIKTDSDEKVISYRKEDGTLVENVGIEINHLELTEQGMTDFQQALKDAGFNPGGSGDFSDYISNDGKVPLYISEPRCALVNISGVDDMPATKTANLHACIEVYDYNGNYFRKKILLNAQGNSSLSNPQKNFAIDMFDSEWEEDAFSLKIGNWVPQDSFHFKCFYYDPSRGLGDVIFKFAENAIKFTNTRPNRLVLNKETTTVHSDAGNFSHDYCSEPLCHPDGFPAVVYLNGEFYGLFAWNLKKHRDNYMMNKKDYESIHIDSDTANLWSSAALDWTQFEIRNPKTLICMDGSKYDGDSPQELIDTTSPNYDASNKDHKNTVKTKNLINTLHTVVPMINAASTTEEKKALFEQYFDVDSFIVFWIISQVTDNYDGLWGRNTQWLYYKESGKWCPSLYDLDSCFGYKADIPWLYEPFSDILYPETSLPYGLLWSLYRNEIKQVYANLRSNNIVSTDTFVSYYNDWCMRFGNFNLKRSIDKWNTPCYRDGKLNREYWKLIGPGPKGSPETYSDTATYNVGDIVNFGIFFWDYILKYECIKSCTGQAPAGRYDEKPYYGGVFDSPRRIKVWLDAKIAILDSIMNYNV